MKLIKWALMSGEFKPEPALFDLDTLDQNSVEAARIAQEAEYRRVQSSPDHAEAMARYAHLIQELDTSRVPLELKTVDFLQGRAIDIATRLQTDPSAVPEESAGLAARFFGASDTSSGAIIAAFHKYDAYFYTLSWAVGNGMTVAQAREALAELQAQPEPRFAIDPNLRERPLRSDDPFRAAFQYDDFKIDDTDQEE